MRIQEISAYSLEQAINTAETEYNFINVKDATDFFYQSKLDFEHFFDANQDKFEDQCAIICIEKGSYKENKFPYTLHEQKNLGRTTKVRVFDICKVSDNTVVGTASTKAKAIKLAKQLMHAEKTDLYCKQYYKVTSPNAIAFTLDYTPMKDAKTGTYVVLAK